MERSSSETELAWRDPLNWYVGNLSQIKATELLSNSVGRPGDFIVRKSSEKGCFVIVVIREPGIVCQIKLKAQENGFFSSNNEHYKTIQEFFAQSLEIKTPGAWLLPREFALNTGKRIPGILYPPKHADVQDKIVFRRESHFGINDPLQSTVTLHQEYDLEGRISEGVEQLQVEGSSNDPADQLKFDSRPKQPNQYTQLGILHEFPASSQTSKPYATQQPHQKPLDVQHDSEENIEHDLPSRQDSHLSPEPGQSTSPLPHAYSHVQHSAKLDESRQYAHLHPQSEQFRSQEPHTYSSLALSAANRQYAQLVPNSEVMHSQEHVYTKLQLSANQAESSRYTQLNLENGRRKDLKHEYNHLKSNQRAHVYGHHVVNDKAAGYGEPTMRLSSTASRESSTSSVKSTYGVAIQPPNSTYSATPVGHSTYGRAVPPSRPQNQVDYAPPRPPKHVVDAPPRPPKHVVDAPPRPPKQAVDAPPRPPQH